MMMKTHEIEYRRHSRTKKSIQNFEDVGLAEMKGEKQKSERLRQPNFFNTSGRICIYKWKKFI